MGAATLPSLPLIEALARKDLLLQLLTCPSAEGRKCTSGWTSRLMSLGSANEHEFCGADRVPFFLWYPSSDSLFYAAPFFLSFF